MLSGDIIVEQNIHIIDVTNWLLKGHPVKAVGSGGRAGRTDTGDASSHFNCVFTYPNDVHITFGATQFGTAAWGVGMQYYGTKGCAEARYDAAGAHLRRDEVGLPGWARSEAVDQKAAATGAVPRRAGRRGSPTSRRRSSTASPAAKLVNEAEQGAESALAAMLGRLAAYTGREVTWDELMKSTEVYDPKMDFTQFK